MYISMDWATKLVGCRILNFGRCAAQQRCPTPTGLLVIELCCYGYGTALPSGMQQWRGNMCDDGAV